MMEDSIIITEDESKFIRIVRELKDQKASAEIKLKTNVEPLPYKAKTTFQKLDQFIAAILKKLGESYGKTERQELATGLVEYSLGFGESTYVQISIRDCADGFEIKFLDAMVAIEDNVNVKEDERAIQTREWINHKVEDFACDPPVDTAKADSRNRADFDFDVEVFPPPPRPREPDQEHMPVLLFYSLVRATHSFEMRVPSDLPNPKMRQIILDAYQKLSNCGAIRVSWTKLRDELRDKLNAEPFSLPILREQVYAMVRDPETCAEIERRGLTEVIHKPPSKKWK
jgi:hypothetical protein